MATAHARLEQLFGKHAGSSGSGSGSGDAAMTEQEFLVQWSMASFVYVCFVLLCAHNLQ